MIFIGHMLWTIYQKKCSGADQEKVTYHKVIRWKENTRTYTPDWSKKKGGWRGRYLRAETYTITVKCQDNKINVS